MRVGTYEDIDINGTHFVGEITCTRRALELAFGKPNDGDGYKVTTEWCIEFPEGQVATVYDWKRYEEGAPGQEEMYSWHVGGHDKDVVDYVYRTVLYAVLDAQA